ncbi:hypothetical protein STEG23_015434 [Scotinomys teguina]
MQNLSALIGPRGLSKKPLLLTHQGHILDPGMNLTLQCLSDINYDRFVLYKVGEDKLIQHSAQRNQAGLSLVNFTLGPVSNSTGGQYRCYGANNLSSEWSASSDPLDILISGPIGPSSPPPSNLMPTAGACSVVTIPTHEVIYSSGLERYLIGASVALLLVMSILIFLLQRRRQRGKYKENGIHNDKPILSALPGPVATTGGNMILHCVSFGAYDKLILSKEDEKFSTSLDSQYIHHNGQYQAMFSVGPMTPLHIGTFRCYGYYKDAPQLWSVSSDPLEIHISGLSKKPLLLTHQGHILDPGMNLTLQCLSDINYDRFVLYKVGEDKLIQHSAERNQAGLSLVNFTLGPVSNSTGGQYRCYGANNLSSEWSASSDPLDILISGLERYLIGASVAFLLVMSILIFLLQRRRQRGKYKENGLSKKPLLLTHQGHILDPGTSLTLHCLSDINYDRFVLYKVGEDKLIQHSGQRSQAGLSLASFTLEPVSNSTGGQYRCYGANNLSSEWSASSDPLDILISGPIGAFNPRPPIPMTKAENETLWIHSVLKKIRVFDEVEDKIIIVVTFRSYDKKAKMGRRQCKSAYNIIKKKTTPESSPPPTPKSDHCNADKAEENDLKKPHEDA